MKKLAMLIVAGLVLGGAAFAKDENGALGFGIMSDSSETNLVGGGIRGTLFLDVGYQLAGPLFYGFEFQGAVKKLDETSKAFQKTDVTFYFIDEDTYIGVFDTASYKETYTLWDADFSPRGYLSFDLGDKIQLLGFAGLNYNWQTLEYHLKDVQGDQFTGPDGKLTTDYTKSTTFNGSWAAIAGFRVSVGAFYVDYTRFLDADSSGNNLAWDSYNKNRLGLGVNLRF